MNLFLDSSVLLAASGSATGASRALFQLAPQNGMLALRGGELQHHDSVVGLQVRVICPNLLTARFGCEQIEGVLDPDPQQPSAGTAKVLGHHVRMRARALSE